MSKSYKDLEIYIESFDLFLKLHEFSLKLPKHELYELGSQLRRSADSINSNIVEGYGRRKYKNDFIKYLIYSHASNLETINHLQKLKSLYPNHSQEIQLYIDRYEKLGSQIHNFIEYVSKNWKS